MRDDLNKQLCERERRGSRMKYRSVRHKKKHDLPLDEEGENTRSRESMTFRYDNTKSFNENLKPLYGAVRKAVGRRWDTFYSELCQAFNMRSVINQHILQHLEWYCERNVVIQDGQLFVREYPSFPLTPLRESKRTEFYVDPRDGIIKKNKWFRKSTAQELQARARQEKEEAAKHRQLDDNNVLHLIDGVWFHFTLKDIPEGKEVIVRPEGVEFFKDYKNRRKTWDQLQDHDKRRLGKKIFVGERATDLYTGESIYNDNGKSGVRSYFRNTYVLFRWPTPKGKYHATKKAASHQMLKKAGIVK